MRLVCAFKVEEQRTPLNNTSSIQSDSIDSSFLQRPIPLVGT